MHLTDEDRTYNDCRPVFIGVCPECGAEIDEDDVGYCEDSQSPSGIGMFWICDDCGRDIDADEAYTI